MKVFENRFGPKSDEVTGEWRKLHSEELNGLYSTPNTFRVIKSRIGGAGHVQVWGRGEVHTEFWWGNLRKRGHLEDPSVNGKIMLIWIFRE